MSETNYVPYGVVGFNPNGAKYKSTEIAIEAACIRGDIRAYNESRNALIREMASKSRI